MAFQGEYFIDRYGAKRPSARHLSGGCWKWAFRSERARTRRASPAITLSFPLLADHGQDGRRPGFIRSQRFDREEALRLYTVEAVGFLRRQEKRIDPSRTIGRPRVLSADYFSIPEDEIKRLESVLTIVGGKTVYATGPFSKLAPTPLPVSPDWSPVKTFGGYARGDQATQAQAAHLVAHQWAHSMGRTLRNWADGSNPWNLGCDCLAFI